MHLLHQRLSALLCSLFEDSRELREFLRRGPEGLALVQSLPGSTVPLRQLVDDVIDLFARRGEVGTVLLAGLVGAFPVRAAEIRRLAAHFGLGPLPAPSSASVFFALFDDADAAKVGW